MINPNAKFQPSSRITAMVEGRKSTGASCNTYQLEDSISSIADGHAWSYKVLAYQGAPSIDFSNLRPKDSPLSTGGHSSGAVSFIEPFDAIVSTMRRQDKKNGAGIAYLNYDHPEIDSFLSLNTRGAYKAVYIPMHNTKEAELFLSDEALVEKLSRAYNEFKCFLVKRPLPTKYGTPLLVNLCTEIEIPHRGSCVLGAINLGQFNKDNLNELPKVFSEAALEMYGYLCDSIKISKVVGLSSEHKKANFQFGLGVYGLASLLANLGMTYEEFDHELRELCENHDGTGLALWLDLAYQGAASLLRPLGVRAAFCIQPTVSTARRSKDINGFDVSPEIQPVVGMRHEGGVSTIVKSGVKGDTNITYDPRVETIEDVPYEVYARISANWQRMMDNTKLAHRHSHCFYGQKFTADSLRALYLDPTLKHIKSIYYRLPYNQNPSAMDKGSLWKDFGKESLVDFDVDALLNGCQIAGGIECECQN